MSEMTAGVAQQGIYVAGHAGLAGSALVRRLRRDGITRAYGDYLGRHAAAAAASR